MSWIEKALLPQAQHVNGNVYRVKYTFEGVPYNLYFPLRQDYNLGGILYAVTRDDITYCLDQQKNVPFLIKGEDFSPETTIFVFDTINDEERRLNPTDAIL